MNTLYALVENNEIQRINIQLPTAIGNTSIPAGASNLQQFNLYEIQGSELQYNSSTQRLQGPSYVFDAEAGVVNRIYTVEDIALTNLRNQQWENIKAIRERKTLQGGYAVQGKWFHSDTFSRSQQLGLVLLGNSIPQGLQWKTMDGSFIEMTPALAQQVFQAAVMQDSALFNYAESLRAAVDASNDPMQIDINSNWPSTFGDV
jgi:hypothetical protein